MEAVFALLVTLVIAVLPALLFLGLWYGLDYLRDDDLLRKARDERYSDVPDYQPRFLDRDIDIGQQSSPSSGVRCTECGTRNRHGMNYCQECLSELPAVNS